MRILLIITFVFILFYQFINLFPMVYIVIKSQETNKKYNDKKDTKCNNERKEYHKGTHLYGIRQLQRRQEHCEPKGDLKQT